MEKRLVVTALVFLMVICLSCSSTETTIPTTPASASAIPEFNTEIKLSTYQQVTLEETSDILGVALPEPAYLPEGLQVQEVYVYYYPPGGYHPQGEGTVLTIFSDGKVEKELIEYTDQDGITRLKYNIECRIRLQIDWLGGEKFIPIKVPPGLESVKINGNVGFIREKANVNTLTWQFSEFQLYLSASKDALKEELIKIAESVS